MENNLPIITKKIWSIVRVVFFMLRKGISKSKLMMDLNNIMLKRGKIAGKAISNLLHHHHHGSGGSTSSRRYDAREYEFSCSNTPNYVFPLTKRHHKHLFKCTHAPLTQDDVFSANAVKAVLEMLNNDDGVVEASPALPGFGRSPVVRQLRITDSPFPLNDTQEDHRVDEAAEKFIQRFYKELRKQK